MHWDDVGILISLSALVVGAILAFVGFPTVSSFYSCLFQWGLVLMVIGAFGLPISLLLLPCLEEKLKHKKTR